MSAGQRQGTSPAISRTLEGTTLVLSAVHDAMDAVPLVKQILGAATLISGFAEVRCIPCDCYTA